MRHPVRQGGSTSFGRDFLGFAADKEARLAALGLGRDAYLANPGRLKMTRLIAAAALIIAITAPAFACEWNKSAGADSQSTVASQSSGAQQSKPVQQHKRS
jgi:hypothetical protein